MAIMSLLRQWKAREVPYALVCPLSKKLNEGKTHFLRHLHKQAQFDCKLLSYINVHTSFSKFIVKPWMRESLEKS